MINFDGRKMVSDKREFSVTFCILFFCNFLYFRNSSDKWIFVEEFRGGKVDRTRKIGKGGTFDEMEDTQLPSSNWSST